MTTQNQNPETIETETLSTEEAVTNELIEDAAQTNHLEVIETVISSMDEDDNAMVSKTESGHLWKFHYGTVEVFVQMTGETDEDLLTVWSPVLSLPVKDEPGLMRRLLEMNWSDTFETAFAIMNNQVVISAQRTIAELSPGEISRAITLVATIADNNNEIFKEQFGAS